MDSTGLFFSEEDMMQQTPIEERNRLHKEGYELVPIWRGNPDEEPMYHWEKTNNNKQEGGD